MTCDVRQRGLGAEGLLVCAEDNKRLAAAADAAKLKKLHKEARRDSKFVRKKLQRQVEPGESGKGTKQKLQAELKEVDPFETEDALVRRDSNQGGEQSRKEDAQCWTCQV